MKLSPGKMCGQEGGSGLGWEDRSGPSCDYRATNPANGRVIESGAGLYPWGWAPPAVAEPEVAV